MWEVLKDLLWPNQFIPHGHCYLWKPGLVSLHFASDLLIAIAYYSIPTLLIYFIQKRKNFPFRRIFWLFGAFIVLCGTTHIMAVWTLWHPTYWLTGFVKLITAGVSLFTAFQLVHLLPLALALPNPAQLEETNLMLLEEIQERKRVETSLRESEERWQLVIQGNNDGIWDWNIETNQIFYSPRWKEMLGYEEDEIAHCVEEWNQRVHPEDIALVQEKFEAYLQRQHPYYQAEYRLRCKDGSYKWILGQGQALWNSAGLPIRMVGSHKDITDRKQAEIELQQAKAELEQRVSERTTELSLLNHQLRQEILERREVEAALRHSEQRYRSLVEAASQVVWLADSTGQSTGVIWGWQEITGQTPEEMKGWGWLDVIHPDDREHSRRFWAEAVASKSCFESEYRLRTQTGSYRSFLSRGVPVLDQADRVLEWVGTCIDITERKQAQAALLDSRNQLETEVHQRTQELTIANAALQAEIAERLEAERQLSDLTTDLQRSNQELEQFAYVASHDLQEPLRAITSYTQMLAKRYQGNLDEKADKYIYYIVDGATRMQQLIQDLLSYSRVGRSEMKLHPVDCEALIKRVLKDLQVSIAENCATICIETLPSVVADASQLAQVFQNIIGNAIKYRSNEPPKIHVSATQQGDEWVFSIQDNGIGIEPQYADRIFGIFQRLHTRREYAGTGLGLAICKKIIERHNGTIWLSSEAGAGATFYFSLPVLNSSED
jgi:PAS domain S-box-containing protein